MRFKIWILSFLCVVSLESCQQPTTAKKTSAGISESTTQNLSDACSSAVKNALGLVSINTIGLADLQIPPIALTITSTTNAPTAPTATINLDYTKLAGGMGPDGQPRKDIAPTFLVWNSCLTGTQQCQKPQISYKYVIPDVQFPKGLNTVSVRLCVDNLVYISDADKNKAKNFCSPNTPCYCGAPTSQQYANSDDPVLSYAPYQQALTDLSEAENKMYSLASSYVTQAREYAGMCASQDANAPLYTYAVNVANLGASQIALYTEQYGEELAQALQDAQRQGNGLQLADSCGVSPSGGSSGSSASDSSLNSLLGSLTGGSSGGLGTSSGPEPDILPPPPSEGPTSTNDDSFANNASSPSIFTTTGTSVGTSGANQFAAPTGTNSHTSKNDSTLSKVLIGIGVVSLLASVGFAGHYLSGGKFPANLKNLVTGKKKTTVVAEEGKKTIGAKAKGVWKTIKGIFVTKKPGASPPPDVAPDSRTSAVEPHAGTSGGHPPVVEAHAGTSGGHPPVVDPPAHPTGEPPKGKGGPGKGTIAGAVLTGIIGIGGILGGSGVIGLTNTLSCGNFNQIIHYWEPQLYNQALVIKTDIANVSTQYTNAVNAYVKAHPPQ